MVSSIVSLFHSTFTHTAKDPAAGVKRRLATLPVPQAESLVANDDLRGFLKATFRLHEERRIPEEDWTGIAHFLMRARRQTPRSIVHVEKQWPRAVESWDIARDLLRTPRSEGVEPAPKTIAKLQALLAYLKQHAARQSWLSHGFDVELSQMADDRTAIASRRMEVLQLAAIRIGPMDREQLLACRQHIATLLEDLPPDAYPCIRDALSRVANEASWQMALFCPPEDAMVHAPDGRPVSAEACP